MSFARNIEWLMEPQNHEIVELVVEKNKVPFPYSSNIGTGYTEHIDLFDEIRIIKHAHYFTG